MASKIFSFRIDDRVIKEIDSIVYELGPEWSRNKLVNGIVRRFIRDWRDKDEDRE